MGPMIAVAGSTTPAIDAIRLSIHVLAACVWVGGQITIAGLVPAAKRLSEEAPRAIARAFARLSWPAFALLLATGIWNIAAVDPGGKGNLWQALLGAKVAVVVLAGVAAFLHSRASSRRGLAVWGAIAGSSSLAALVLGVVIAG